MSAFTDLIKGKTEKHPVLKNLTADELTSLEYFENWTCLAAYGAEGLEQDFELDSKRAAALARVAASEAAKEVTSAPAAPAVPATPTPAPAQHVTVQMQQSYQDMRIPQLFEALVADPNDDEALAELQSRDQYIAAERKTNNTTCVNEAGALDVAATTKYWQYLSRHNTKPQTRFQGLRTTTLEKALGRKEKEMLHPLFNGEIIYMGVDTWGCDWNKVDNHLMEAVYWARTTRHQMFPTNPDPINTHAELIADTLERRWKIIKEDYEAFEEEGGSVSLIVVEGGMTGQTSAPFRLRTQYGVEI